MFVWARSIDPPVLDRATQTLPFLLASTLKLSILEITSGLETF